MKTFKTFFISAVVLISFVALAETIYDMKFYSSDFMADVKEVKVETRVPVIEATEVVAVAKKALPRMQRVDLSQSDFVNGEWEVVRVLDADLKPVYDKSRRYEDKNSRVVVNLSLVDISTVKINDDNNQIFNISLMTKAGTIALFKPFGKGYEILEARRVVKEVKKVVAEQAQPKKHLSKIENRFKENQELTLVSALNPTKSGEVLKNNKISGTAYMMGDQIMFDNLSLHVGSKLQTEALSFEAKLDGNTGHINYNNEIQGIVSVVGNKEIRVRFSTGPLANAMLNFKIPGTDEEQEDNTYSNEDVASAPVVAPPANAATIQAARETASDVSNANIDEANDEVEVNVEEAGYEF
jgi:hypothetical protein